MTWESWLDQTEWERIALLVELGEMIERANASGAGELDRPKKQRR